MMGVSGIKICVQIYLRVFFPIFEDLKEKLVFNFTEFSLRKDMSVWMKTEWCALRKIGESGS